MRFFTLFLTISISLSSFICAPTMGQNLSIHQAIHRALQHNETVLYQATHSYAIAGAQLRSVEAMYHRTLDATVRFTRQYARDRFPLSQIVAPRISRIGEYL